MARNCRCWRGRWAGTVPERNLPAHEAIVARLCSRGFEAWITGGAVRDMLLGREPVDFDVTTSAGLDEIVALFQGERVEQVGRSFNLILVNGVEVATFRRGFSAQEGSGREDCPSAGLLQDLGLRDLTCNSMALCPFSGELIDPFDGRQDLANRVVRLVGDPIRRIRGDPVRIVRACRFASDLKGTFEEASLRALQDMAGLVTTVAPERLRLEVKKALSARQASNFFRNLRLVGALGHLFPGLAACVGFDGGPHHGEDVFEHCLLTGDAVAPRCWLTRLAGYLHDVGKPVSATLDDQGRAASFIGHEAAGAWIVEQDLGAMKFSARETAIISSLIRVHMHCIGPNARPRAVRRLLARLDRHRLDYRAFLRLSLADHKGNLARPNTPLSQNRALLNTIEELLYSSPRQREFNRSMLAVNGTDLMRELDLRPGRTVGWLLDALFEHVLDHPDRNDRATLLSLARGLLEE
jgi:tRNA nucleotidyltransferase (CCA-adding enzyme)